MTSADKSGNSKYMRRNQQFARAALQTQKSTINGSRICSPLSVQGFLDQNQGEQESYDGVISEQDQLLKTQTSIKFGMMTQSDINQNDSQRPDDRSQACKIKKPNTRKRPFRISEQSKISAQNARLTQNFFAPAKLLEISPHNSTAYDFDQYAPRGELFPVQIQTNADYNDGAAKAVKTVCSTRNM